MTRDQQGRPSGGRLLAHPCMHMNNPEHVREALEAAHTLLLDVNHPKQNVFWDLLKSKLEPVLAGTDLLVSVKGEGDLHADHTVHRNMLVCGGVGWANWEVSCGALCNGWEEPRGSMHYSIHAEF